MKGSRVPVLLTMLLAVVMAAAACDSWSKKFVMPDEILYTGDIVVDEEAFSITFTVRINKDRLTPGEGGSWFMIANEDGSAADEALFTALVTQAEVSDALSAIGAIAGYEMDGMDTILTGEGLDVIFGVNSYCGSQCLERAYYNIQDFLVETEPGGRSVLGYEFRYGAHLDEDNETGAILNFYSSPDAVVSNARAMRSDWDADGHQGRFFRHLDMFNLIPDEEDTAEITLQLLGRSVAIDEVAGTLTFPAKVHRNAADNGMPYNCLIAKPDSLFYGNSLFLTRVSQAEISYGLNTLGGASGISWNGLQAEPSNADPLLKFSGARFDIDVDWEGNEAPLPAQDLFQEFDPNHMEYPESERLGMDFRFGIDFADTQEWFTNFGVITALYACTYAVTGNSVESVQGITNFQRFSNDPRYYADAEALPAEDTEVTIVFTIDPIPYECQDMDGDGYDDVACGGGDCDDAEAAVSPNADEICDDGVDNDCHGAFDVDDDDADGYNDVVCGGDDCDDAAADVNPGVDESEIAGNCGDGIDNDCDGLADFDDCCTDADGDGFGVEGGACGDVDCDDANPFVKPGATEICIDGIDNDCDGAADAADDDCCADDDGDGYSPAGGACGDIDCDDTDTGVNPGVDESEGAGNCADGVDNDCDGLTDTDPECTGTCFLNMVLR